MIEFLTTVLISTLFIGSGFSIWVIADYLRCPGF